MTTSKLVRNLLVVAALAALAAPAAAGRGGSANRIRNAVTSGSADAIIAEIERAERLVSAECVEVVMPLLDHGDERVRDVAAWWLAKRPMLAHQLAEQAAADLAGANSVAARNAADLLGSMARRDGIEALAAAVVRTELDAEARAHAARALGKIAHISVNPALTAAMSDGDAQVRYEAVHAWRDVRGQAGAAPVVALIGDADTQVRREAAIVVGGLRDASGRTALEARLTDPDPAVRRNAAWALGRIGDVASRPALQAATADESSLVRGTARNALRQLR